MSGACSKCGGVLLGRRTRFCASCSPSPPQAGDRRYHGQRWTALSKLVRRRDGRCMVAPGCAKGAQVADHIRPVYPGMPNAEFYDPRNLRGSCREHNVKRGVAARLEREMAGLPEPAPPPRTRYGQQPYTAVEMGTRPAEPDRLAGRIRDVRYHWCSRSGQTYIYGSTSLEPRWTGSGCPPECPSTGGPSIG